MNLNSSEKRLIEEKRNLKPEVFICSVCTKKFKHKTNLYIHQRNIHKLTGDKDPVPKKIRSLVCHACGNTFVSKNCLAAHLKKIHGLEKNRIRRVLCPICSEQCHSYVALNQHLTNSHQITLEYEDLIFKTEKEFLTWKYNVETKTSSRYVSDHAPKNMSEGGIKQFFNCNRSHYYRKTGKNVRKATMTIKTGIACPSRIVVIVKGGYYLVHFCKTHLGHTREVSRKFLDKNIRSEIAEMMKNGKTFKEILETAQNTTDNPQLQLLTRKDLHNIARDYKINVKAEQMIDHEARKKRLAKMTQKKPERQINIIKKRHMDSFSIKKEMIEFVKNGQWSITSVGSQRHLVTLTDTNCENCTLKCEECNECLHKFKCTCVDSSVNLNMCKHIHASITYEKELSNETKKWFINSQEVEIVHEKDTYNDSDADYEKMDVEEDNKKVKCQMIRKKCDTIHELCEKSEISYEDVDFVADSLDIIINSLIGQSEKDDELSSSCKNSANNNKTLII